MAVSGESTGPESSGSRAGPAAEQSGAGGASLTRTLSNWQLASYGAPAMPLSMVALPMAVYLPAVYADSEGFGLGLAFVGLVMVLSREFRRHHRPPHRLHLRSNPHTLGPAQTLCGDRHTYLRRRHLAAVHSTHRIRRTWTLFGLTFNSGYPWMLMTLVITFVGATIKDVPYSAWGPSSRPTTTNVRWSPAGARAFPSPAR